LVQARLSRGASPPRSGARGIRAPLAVPALHDNSRSRSDNGASVNAAGPSPPAVGRGVWVGSIPAPRPRYSGASRSAPDRPARSRSFSLAGHRSPLIARQVCTRVLYHTSHARDCRPDPVLRRCPASRTSAVSLLAPPIGAAGLLPARRAALTSLHLSRRERQMPCSCCSCNCKATLLAASLTTLHVTISGTGACGWDGTYTLTWNGSLWRYQNFSPPACSIQNIVFDVTTGGAGSPCCMILRCDCVGCSFVGYAILIETSGTTNGTWASCNCSTGNFVANPYSNSAFLCNCSSFTNISVSISP